eukprot:m.18397 g.18397  ORF g.18397 m.18397 type:complete len:829 (-) comp7819_c0_seq1:334-2820(-)
MTTNDGMQNLIGIVNQLQDAFSSLGSASPLDLPQIAVVGGQSAGKSSVLENFVGKDFLPRGSGIVTRRPLVLQLQYHPTEEYGEFLHCRGHKFTNFDDIRQEIEDETERSCPGKGISSHPINLRVHSPHVLNLTLVDLPGMTKVAVEGQPQDIEMQIRSMIMEFITRDNCIILAVSPANSDLANSDALKLAKEVDPQGTRTVGVITKLDLMDEGTDARNILTNQLLPLRRGYIGVVNRSQKDINGKKDIRAALEAERRFFMGHQSYRDLADKQGTPFLQRTLNQQLTNHIRETLPELKSKLSKQVRTLEEQVREFDRTDAGDAKKATKTMVQLINAFASNYEKKIEGSGEVNVESLSSGAKIYRVFHERFPFEIAKMEVDERTLRREISFAIKNIRGIRVGLFTPDQAFEAVARRLIEKLKGPCLKCVELVSAELQDVIHDIVEDMNRFPRLKEECETLVLSEIATFEQAAQDYVTRMIDIELSYMNTNHPDFIGFAQASSSTASRDKRSVQSGAEQTIRKGWLSTGTGGTFSRQKLFFFVLTTSNLVWYKDEEMNETKYNLALDGVKLLTLEDAGGFMRQKRAAFQLFHPDKKFLFKNHETLELIAESEEQMESWQASFLRAGVQPSNSAAEDDTLESESFDPQFERQVETIRNLVDSYMSIVTKTLRDQIPKVSMCMMINSLKEFISDELMAHLYRTSAESLMEEDPALQRKRDEVRAMYETSKTALKIIGDISMHTRSESLPPPVENSISVAPPRPPMTSQPRAPPPRGSAAPPRTVPPRATPPARAAPPPAPAARPRAAPKAPPPVPSSRPQVPSTRPNVPARP